MTAKHHPASLARRATRLALAALAGFGAAMACAALAAGMAAFARPALPALAAPAAPSAQTHTWPGGAAPCDTPFLQHCIDGVPDGGTIIIQAGTHIQSVTLNRPISLTGVSSATAILHAWHYLRALVVTGAAISNSVVISGLTITGGEIDGGSSCPAHCGGGVLITGTAQPLLVNLVITNNQAWRGGGLYAHTGSSLALIDTQVISNTSLSHGGGAYADGPAMLNGGLFRNNMCTQDTNCAGGGLLAAALALTSTQFMSNTSRYDGGGVYASGPATLNGGLFQGNQCTHGICGGGGLRTHSTLALTGTQFMSNTSLGHGGGVRAGGAATLNGGQFYHNQCANVDCGGGGLIGFNVLTLTSSSFVSNTSHADGGGVYAVNAATVNGGLFQGNQCAQGDCQGGGLRAGSRLTMTAAAFRSNAASGGGGIYFNGLTAIITNSLLAGNSGSNGAALLVDSAGSLTLAHNTFDAPASYTGTAVSIQAGSVGITNTIFANHDVGIERVSGNVYEDYNLFDSVLVPASGGGIASPGNSITGTAAFAAGGDYRLTPASDALDAGTDAGVSVDFEGQPRPQGAGFDIGWDELLQADLSVSKTASHAQAAPGQAISYTIVINNAGPGDAGGVLVNDPLPPALTGATWTCSGTGGSTCPAGGAGTGNISVPVTVTAGGTVQFGLLATITTGAGGSAITNTATLTPPPGLFDTDTADNSASAVVQVEAPVVDYRLYLPVIVR